MEPKSTGMDSHENNSDWESIQFRESLREWRELKESIFIEEVSLEGWPGWEKSSEKSMEIFHRLNSKTKKLDPRSRPSHRALQSHAEFHLHPIGRKKTKATFQLSDKIKRLLQYPRTPKEDGPGKWVTQDWKTSRKKIIPRAQRAFSKPTAKWQYEMSLMPPQYLHITTTKTKK